MRAIGPEQMGSARGRVPKAETHEWDHATSHAHARVARMGLVFTPQADAGETADSHPAWSIRTLRVLNALRDYRVCRAADHRTAARGARSRRMVDTLAAHGQPCSPSRSPSTLATRLSSPMVQHWAVAKVASNPDAPDLAWQAVLSKLSAMPGASYASVAEGAGPRRAAQAGCRAA